MRVLWLTGLVIVLDQITKQIVMRTMYLGQQIHLLGDWLKFTYTENPGMAFGITFGPKGMVTMFSVIATVLIILYLVKVRKGYLPYRASLGFILGGAIGNIIDRVFYGVLFGNETLFTGKVVDFIHVNVWSGFIPEAVPLMGGTYLSLFPIWNVADMAIVCGVVGILFFQKMYHMHEYGLIDESEERKWGPERIDSASGQPAITRPATGEPDAATGEFEAATGESDAATGESDGATGESAAAEPGTGEPDTVESAQHDVQRMQTVESPSAKERDEGRTSSEQQKLFRNEESSDNRQDLQGAESPEGQESEAQEDVDVESRGRG